MVGSFVRLAPVAVLCAALGACSTVPSGYDRGDVGDNARSAPPRSPDSVLQCVPYARDHSRIALYGDAYTWWGQAEGRYARAGVPSEGSVLVLYNYAGAERAHLAVVRSIVNEREIRVDHANWLDDGEIFLNDPVHDVSPDNDWSQVRVYNIRNGAWGVRTYPVQGFIGPGPDTNPVLVAQKPSSVRVAQQPAEPQAAQHDYVADLLDSDPAFSGAKPAASDAPPDSDDLDDADDDQQ